VNPLCSVRLSFAEDLALWAELGVRQVGLASVKVDAHGWDQAAADARAAELDVRYVLHGIYTPVTDESGWRRETDQLLRCIELAASVGASSVCTCSGPPGGLRWEDALDALEERLAPVRDAARGAGIDLALENSLSVRSEFSFLHSVADAMVAAERLDIGVNVDVYCCWVERSLARTLRDNVDRVKLVQFADFVIGTPCQPNRWVPGDGDLPLARLVDDILAAGSAGTFDLEVLGPAIDEIGPAAAIARGTAWLGDRLRERGA
jgi:sugar phosphate isomerase/epimerase